MMMMMMIRMWWFWWWWWSWSWWYSCWAMKSVCSRAVRLGSLFVWLRQIAATQQSLKIAIWVFLRQVVSPNQSFSGFLGPWNRKTTVATLGCTIEADFWEFTLFTYLQSTNFCGLWLLSTALYSSPLYSEYTHKLWWPKKSGLVFSIVNSLSKVLVMSIHPWGMESLFWKSRFFLRLYIFKRREHLLDLEIARADLHQRAEQAKEQERKQRRLRAPWMWGRTVDPICMTTDWYTYIWHISSTSYLWLITSPCFWAIMCLLRI